MSAVTPKVAVIGGGAAGLAAARVLSRNGIRPVVFEKDAASGGVWRHISGAKTRPMYKGLRTNLPREIMAYREKPWGGDGEGRSYVTHQDVARYLQDYEKQFDLGQFISYGTQVTQLTVNTDTSSSFSPQGDNAGDEQWPQITLEWKEHGSTSEQSSSDTFDAVCVCNGHFAAPSIPNLPGLKEHFRGQIMHSVEYDDPAQFEGQTVLCVGGRASGADLAREISMHASQVYLSDTTCDPLTNGGQPHTSDNVLWVPRTMAVEEGSTIRFGDGCAVAPDNVDTIIFCSGYDYQFPFINDQSCLDFQAIPGERRIKPLYEQLWHAGYPNLAFVGLPHSVLPFPCFELQMEAIVAQYKGARNLPSKEERLAAAEKDANSGGPKPPGRIQNTHFLGGFQWDYFRTLAKMANLYDDQMESFIATNKAIYDHAGKERKTLFPGGPDTYRYNCYIRKDEDQSFEVHRYTEKKDSSVPDLNVETT
eukprot:CAMPEP_0195303238 /NCGR_PEP_ID=MMETSP0707-20130614/32454_1 /TAXON_ID=33640 /ORGANISM="Asterionellopsis glacialis, Strain CCMP134" /LENGTH=476 /DNA_ID=CAMNT_0040366725 /DNA_START=164 /DNA_END=1590 /DNA_ORIENTATION=-